MRVFPILALMLSLAGAQTLRVPFRPTASTDQVSAETRQREGERYHLVSVSGYGRPAVVAPAGVPSLPFAMESFLLPPGTGVDSIRILSARWEPLPGDFRPLPVQLNFGEERSFVAPDPAVYRGEDPYPRRPVEVLRQGFAGGYSVVTLCGWPVRYVPQGGLEVLVSLEFSLHCSPLDREPALPDRESRLCAAVRRRAVEALVSNPADTSMYARVPRAPLVRPASRLQVTEAPSPDGDCVDMVIVTSGELEDAFEELAEYRTRRGAVTVVRTVEWIDQHYSGCDTPERIRNFLRHAHQRWGIQFALLGGDDDVVPVRETGGWNYLPVPFPLYCLPSDDYYGDLDGVWSAGGSGWSLAASIGYLDISTGRWPVGSPEEVGAMLEKLSVYENEPPPGEFARRILLLGSNNPQGTGADDLMLLADMLREHAVPDLLDDPAELYYPHSLPGGDLDRNSALQAMDDGYSLVVHADHSGLHKLGTAGKGTLGEYMWDSDFATMGNQGQPSILWTLGCDAGHFDGASCFVESGLITSSQSGLLAAIANPRGGIHDQVSSAYVFFDALFDTGHTAELFGFQALHWPLSFLGEAFRVSKNRSGFSYIFLNLLGSPMLHVWRGEPRQLYVAVSPPLATEGDTVTVTATVSDGAQPVPDASVCLWKRDELYSVRSTDAYGTVSFPGVCAVDGSDGQAISLTAVRRRMPAGAGTVVDACIPGEAFVDILPAQTPLVSLSEAVVDGQGDGAASPGETVEIALEAANTGGQPATGVSASISVKSGSQYVSSVPDSTADLPDIGPDQTETALDPVAVAISPTAPAGAMIGLEAEFSYQGPGGSHQRQYGFTLPVESAEYVLTVCDTQASYPGGTTAEVSLQGIVMANTGLAGDPQVLLTAANPDPPAPFAADTLSVPGIPPNTAVEVEGTLWMEVTPEDSTSDWLRDGFPGCSFDLVALSASGSLSAGSVDVHLADSLQSMTIDPPYGTAVTDAEEDRISLAWEHGGNLEASGYYVYLMVEGSPVRLYPLPVPVRQLEMAGLQPGTEYSLRLTALDAARRESVPAEVTVETTCPPVEGWPLALGGSPGAGPVAADVDSDSDLEIVLTSSFGKVLIADRGGGALHLQPPSGFDYDRFLGSAVGDVTGDGREDVVVAVQRFIGLADEERVSILLFSRPFSTWTCREIAASETNEELATPLSGITPVLLQADGTGELEIALRTRAGDGGTPRLYLWKRDPRTDQWGNFSEDFPMQVAGGFFAPPAAADFDGDGREELLVTGYASYPPGTELILLDFEEDGGLTVVYRNLEELNTEGYIARAFGTLAAAREGGSLYVVGAAKPESYSSNLKKLFACTVTPGDTASIDLVWQTEWLTGRDFFGNMTGPSLSDVNSDSSLEVLYMLNGGQFASEGVLTAWSLQEGTMVYQSQPIPFNPIAGRGGADVKSQPTTGLSSSPGSGGSAAMAGFSTLCVGVDPLLPEEEVPGFPAWSGDAVWASPLVCDLDGDGAAEVLHVDDSGQAVLFDLSQYAYVEGGWSMYQANPRRTGLLPGASPAGGEPLLDVSLRPSSSAAVTAASSPSVAALLDVRPYAPDGEGPASRSALAPPDPAELRSVPGAAAGVPCRESVEVAAFEGQRLLGTAAVPLERGISPVTVRLSEWPAEGEVLLVADPGHRIPESDHTNNSLRVATASPSAEAVAVPSPSPLLRAAFILDTARDDGALIEVYSTAGRLVRRTETGPLPAGTTTLKLEGADRGGLLPAGMYVLRITGLESGTAYRKTVLVR